MFCEISVVVIPPHEMGTNYAKDVLIKKSSESDDICDIWQAN
jgi:hypothetical protein